VLTSEPSAPARRPHKIRSRKAAWLSALAVGAVLIPATVTTTASADPKPTIEAVQAKVDQLNNRAGLLAEQYNAGVIALDEAKRAAESARAKAAAQQAAVHEQQQRVEALAVAAFRSGGVDNALALMTSEDPEGFIRRADTLRQINRAQGDVLRDTRIARQRAEVASTEAKQREAAVDARAKDLARSKGEVEKILAQQETLLNGLKAEERQRLAELQRQREEAALRAAQVAAQAEAARQEAARQAAARAEAARQEAAARAAREAARKPVVVPSQPSAPAPAPAPPPPPPPPAPAPAPPPPPPAPAPAPAPASKAKIAVDAALSQLGKPYVWGAAGPNSYDCSGLTMWAYAKAGIRLSHYTGYQWNEGRHVSRDQLLPGDLVFFYPDHHHVGIYIGGGKVVHAPHTGDVVKITAIQYMPFSGAVRVVG
jgi:cell wall-associated NlpC family hydrolase